MSKLQPTLKKTKENDYLADNGLWYPSNKLEGYLQKRPNYSWVEAAGFLLEEGFIKLRNDLNRELLGK